LSHDALKQQKSQNVDTTSTSKLIFVFLHTPTSHHVN